MKVLSVNTGRPLHHPTAHSPDGTTGIDKRPTDGPVAVTAPGPKGSPGAGSALAGDTIGNTRHHGGTYQAVYAYAREDLDTWSHALARPLPPGAFGENLTTEGLDITGARIGERWRIGPEVVLEVCAVRTPCRTFAAWLGEQGWLRRFTEAAVPGAYLRVVTPGHITAGDPVAIVRRPQHDVTVGLTFRALTTRADLLPRLLAAREHLAPEDLATVEQRLQRRPRPA